MARPKEYDNLIDKTKKRFAERVNYILQRESPQQQSDINSIPDIYDMYRKRQELASEEYAEQRRLAEQQANIAREALAKQIEKQRYDYLRGQQAALDSSYDRGLRLTNALANRGLLTSGMLQLGDVQNRMVTGQTLSSLAEANRDITEAALQAEQAISRGLIDAINRAGLDYQRGMLESDRTAFEQDQALKARQMEYALALLDVLKDENLDQATRDALISIFSPYLGDIPSEDGGSLLDAIKRTTPVTAGEVGDAVFNWIYSVNKEFNKPTYTYNIPGVGKVQFDNPDEALETVRKLYADKPHSDKINIDYPYFGGTNVKATGGSIRFYVDGREFKTYNEALNYYLNVASKK